MIPLAESIRTQSVLSPRIIGPMENTADKYEMVSGYRRLHAAVKAGLETVPAFIYAPDRDAAAIAAADSNSAVCIIHAAARRNICIDNERKSDERFHPEQSLAHR